MKARWITFWAGVVFLTIISTTGYPPLAAAPPTGEVKTVAPGFGYGVLIPYLEMGAANDLMQLLYDSLVGCAPDGKFSPDIGLANKWEMSSDGLTWTFHIRKGVKFHDGVELTAKDVKFTIEKNMGPDSKLTNLVTLRDTIKSMEAKDNYTLVVHCKKPYLFMPDGLFSDIQGVSGSILPKDYYERVGRDKFVKNPIGSGTYKWHSHMIGSYIKLEATDKHWRDGVPMYKYATFRIIPEENTRVAMLKTGEADIARIKPGKCERVPGCGLERDY